MGNGRSQVTFEVVFGVMVAGCATLATVSACQEIPLEVCTALPYTQTGFPNSLGHSSHDQIPANLDGALQTLIILGCYDNAQLFLCAAAFPRCTTSGQLLPPCRALCEGAVSGCGVWFGFYADLFRGINCEAMPNSSDSNICVGLSTPRVTSVPLQLPNDNVTTVYENDSRTNVIHSTGAASVPSTVYTSETLFATPSPRQPTTSPSTEDKDESTEDQNGKPANSTLLNLASSDFSSEVIGQGSTENKGGHKMTDSLDKAVRTENNFAGGSDSHGTVPTLGILLSVLSSLGLVVLLITCTFFRKVFGNPFGGTRRKPREGAFYTNPAFNDLPQTPGVALNGQSSGLQHQPFTLNDLPPHPASDSARPRHSKHTEPNVYQQEAGGFIEQNLFAVPQSPFSRPAEIDHQKQRDSKIDMEQASQVEQSYRVTSDLVYSNQVTSVPVDTNASEGGANASGRDGSNGTAVAPSGSENFPMVSTNVDNGDMIIANPIAC